MGMFTPDLNTLRDLYTVELEKALDMERQIVEKGLPAMIEKNRRVYGRKHGPSPGDGGAALPFIQAKLVHCGALANYFSQGLRPQYGFRSRNKSRIQSSAPAKSLRSRS